RQDVCDPGAPARVSAPREGDGRARQRHFGAPRQLGIHPRVHHREAGIRTLEQRRTAAPRTEGSGCRRRGNHNHDSADAAPRIEVSVVRRTYISAISAIALLVSVATAIQAQQQHTITTVAGGIPNSITALQVGVGTPARVFKDSAGNLYISTMVVGDEGLYGNVVYKVDPSGQLTTVAGNGTEGFSGDGGPATNAALSGPKGVFVDLSGNIFIADAGNARIREVVAATGIIQTVAGNGTNGGGGDGGPATSAQLNGPFDVAVDGSGNVFIADSGNQRIREVVASTGTIQTVAGNGAQGFSGDGGPATSASLRNPFGLSVDGSGNIFIADRD